MQSNSFTNAITDLGVVVESYLLIKWCPSEWKRTERRSFPGSETRAGFSPTNQVLFFFFAGGERTAEPGRRRCWHPSPQSASELLLKGDCEEDVQVGWVSTMFDANRRDIVRIIFSNSDSEVVRIVRIVRTVRTVRRGWSAVFKFQVSISNNYADLY